MGNRQSLDPTGDWRDHVLTDVRRKYRYYFDNFMTVDKADKVRGPYGDTLLMQYITFSDPIRLEVCQMILNDGVEINGLN